MRVMVRYPTSGHPCSYAAERALWLKERRPEWDINFHTNSYAVTVTRNEIVKQAVDQEFDFLIMIDDDVMPSQQILDLPTFDKPVIGGVVPVWQGGHFFWNVFDVDWEKELYHSMVDFDQRPQEVYGVGTGIICIRRDVLTHPAMRPLFEFRTDEWGCMQSVGGEDVYFCVKCRRNNLSVWVDPSCQGEHWRPIGLKNTVMELEKWREHPDFACPEMFAMGLRQIPFELPGRPSPDNGHFPEVETVFQTLKVDYGSSDPRN